MNGPLELISSISDYLIITAVSLVGLVIFLSIIFSDGSKKSESKIRVSLISAICLNIIFYLISSRLLIALFQNQNPDFGLASFIYLLFSSIFLGLTTVYKIKEFLPKSKRGGNLSDAYKEISKENSICIRDLSLLFVFPLVTMYFLGNGSLNSLFILLLSSVFIVFITYTFIFPKILRFFGKSSE